MQLPIWTYHTSIPVNINNLYQSAESKLIQSDAPYHQQRDVNGVTSPNSSMMKSNRFDSKPLHTFGAYHVPAEHWSHPKENSSPTDSQINNSPMARYDNHRRSAGEIISLHPALKKEDSDGSDGCTDQKFSSMKSSGSDEESVCSHLGNKVSISAFVSYFSKSWSDRILKATFRH